MYPTGYYSKIHLVLFQDVSRQIQFKTQFVVNIIFPSKVHLRNVILASLHTIVHTTTSSLLTLRMRKIHLFRPTFVV